METSIAAPGDRLQLEGYAFVFHAGRNEYRRQPDLRRRILSLAEAGHIVNRLPASTSIDALEYRVADGELVVTDGSGWELNINEFGPFH